MAESQTEPKFGCSTFNCKLQYLCQLYSKNLTIMLEPFTGTLWMGWCWSWGSIGRILADIPFESWLSKFRPCPRFGHLPYLPIPWHLFVQINLHSMFFRWNTQNRPSKPNLRYLGTYRKTGWVYIDFEVFFDFFTNHIHFLCHFHDPYLEKAISENFIKLNTFSVLF